MNVSSSGYIKVPCVCRSTYHSIAATGSTSAARARIITVAGENNLDLIVVIAQEDCDQRIIKSHVLQMPQRILREHTHIIGENSTHAGGIHRLHFDVPTSKITLHPSSQDHIEHHTREYKPQPADLQRQLQISAIRLKT